MSRQIRALYDDDTITVYQAYSSAIASSAVERQRLNASPAFKITRMTWIKPSWCWMMYRAGYSFKDPGQERILALRIPHAYVRQLLSVAVLSSDHSSPKDPQSVRIQWDPERNARIQQIPGVRSIQIGIPAALCKDWVGSGILGIEDVTERARELKRILDEEKEISEESLRERGLLTEERVYELPDEFGRIYGEV